MVEFFLLVRPEKIGWLRFILEGYDNLAICSTLAADRGLVQITTIADRYSEAMQLLSALADDLTRYTVHQQH